MARIVVGFDGSDCSLTALRWATAEAIAHGRSMTVVSVLEPRHLASQTSASIVAPPPDRDLDAARQLADTAVAEVIAGVAEPPRTEVSVLVGHAGETLVRVASDADLLVVGSHGRSAIEYMLLGSVSTFAIHHAHCPVAVIRPSH